MKDKERAEFEGLKYTIVLLGVVFWFVTFGIAYNFHDRRELMGWLLVLDAVIFMFIYFALVFNFEKKIKEIEERKEFLEGS